jgi:hypothetical protein
MNNSQRDTYMTIIKNLTHKLFITTLMITITGSYQLHAMEPEIDKDYYETTMNKDFQVHKLWLTLNNDHEWYLPVELVQTIATNVSKFIDKECYKKYEMFFREAGLLVIFIEHNNESISHTSMVHVVKRCLRHSDKSLGEIMGDDKNTIFHLIPCWSMLSIDARLDWIKTFKRIAGSEAWNMICMKDTFSFTALQWSLGSHSSIIKELLSTAPNAQEAWNLIMTTDKTGRTTLDRAKPEGRVDVIQLLESYRPKEQ